MWDSILGHEQNKDFLIKFLQAESRPHALLFCGEEGLGKRALAQQFAKTLLCLHTDGVDNCESCRLLNFADGNIRHPHFLLLAPEEEQFFKAVRGAAAGMGYHFNCYGRKCAPADDSFPRGAAAL